MRAAGRLMLGRGYVATSMGTIAAEAGVAVQTIYNSVGGKADLLAAVLELAAAGPGTEDLLPAALRQRVSAASSSVEIVRILADWFLAVNERTVNVVLMINQAAATSGDAAAIERRGTASRLHTLGEIASAIRALRGLRGGMTDPEAAAAIWAVGHPQVYRMLVSEFGWSNEAYRDWLEKALRGALA